MSIKHLDYIKFSFLLLLYEYCIYACNMIIFRCQGRLAVYLCKTSPRLEYISEDKCYIY